MATKDSNGCSSCFPLPNTLLPPAPLQLHNASPRSAMSNYNLIQQQFGQKTQGRIVERKEQLILALTLAVTLAYTRTRHSDLAARVSFGAPSRFDHNNNACHNKTTWLALSDPAEIGRGRREAGGEREPAKEREKSVENKKRNPSSRARVSH